MAQFQFMWYVGGARHKVRPLSSIVLSLDFSSSLVIIGGGDASGLPWPPSPPPTTLTQINKTNAQPQLNIHVNLSLIFSKNHSNGWIRLFKSEIKNSIYHSNNLSFTWFHLPPTLIKYSQVKWQTSIEKTLNPQSNPNPIPLLFSSQHIHIRNVKEHWNPIYHCLQCYNYLVKALNHVCYNS